MELSPPRNGLRATFLLVACLTIGGCGQLYTKDIANDSLDPNNLSDTEPSIAVNPKDPREIAIVTFSENWSATSSAPVWKSSDRGVTWRKVPQIGQPAANLSGPHDQKIDYDANGTLYVAEIGAYPITDFVFRQTGTPDAPLTPGAGYGNDQPHLSLDRSQSSPRLGQLYSPWLDFGQALERSTVAWSSNQGAAVTSVGAGDNTQFPNRTTRVALCPDGKAYIVYKTREGTAGAPSGFENVHFRVSRSDDGGATWAGLGAGGVSVHGAPQVQSYFTNTFGNLSKGKVARARSSDAWIACDPERGDVYVSHVSRDTSGFAQIYVARSTDRGATWNSRRITDGTHNSAYPEIAVTKRGVVGVLYIDYDDSGPATLFRHRFARSFDRGAIWSHDQILQSMDPGPIGNAASGFLWGDYEGLTAVRNTFYGVYTGESTGRTVLQLDPIFFRQKSCPWWCFICWLERD